MTAYLTLPLAYLIGSIPSGLLVVRLVTGVVIWILMYLQQQMLAVRLTWADWIWAVQMKASSSCPFWRCLPV